MTKFAYNNNWHKVTKMSSFSTLYQNENISKWKSQVQKISENDVSTTRTQVEKVTKLKNQLYKYLKKTRNNQIKYYDKKDISSFFNVDDKILMNFKNIYISKSSKKLNHE